MTKQKIILSGQIIINILCVPFFFIKLIHYEGIFPDGSTVNYYFSPMQNLFDSEQGWLFILSCFFIFGSILFSVLNLLIKNRYIQIITHVIFIISIAMYLIAIMFAIGVGRGF